MRSILSFLILCFAASSVDARPSNTETVRWHSLEEAEKASERKPLLVYFGAEWCPPCKMLETTVFNQPEIQAALKSVRAVYIDGDAPDAPSLMERFDVVVLPSLIVTDGAGNETGRLVGSVEKREFQQFVESASQPASPATLLARVRQGASLSQSDWILLSQIEVSEAAALQYKGEEGKRELGEWQAGLATAVGALGRLHPPLPPVAKARLQIKSLVVDAISTKPEKAIPTHRHALAGVLRDPALLAATERDVINFAEEIFGYVQPVVGEAKRSLARDLIATMETAYAREGASVPWKVELLMLELPLLDSGSDNVDAEKTRFAERVEAALKEASAPADRLAMINLAAEVLRRTGRELRAEAVIRDTLAMQPDAYWLIGALGRYARLRGDRDAAASFAESAYRASLGRTNGLAWGNSWVQALIERNPADTAAVGAAAMEVIDRAIGTRDVFRAWGDDTMVSLATALGRWMVLGERAGAALAPDIGQRFERLCATVKGDAVQHATCKSCLDALSNPPAP